MSGLKCADQGLKGRDTFNKNMKWSQGKWYINDECVGRSQHDIYIYSWENYSRRY